MIKSFAHKGLKRFFEVGSKAGIQRAHRERLRLILTLLNVAVGPRDMVLPGLVLHPLSGNLAEFWSLRVSGNDRVIFKFEGPHAVDVDYVNYH